ncbi:hypothetical protein STVIR_5889 [Streptomyces viridochromogenes Tue57]|uniref:Uncharacterized protein n=1 Tax=Streptomyces viridochromogenes Tue57 TaxID=1160705 RepID=L8PAE3_STRVR|nr:hypothetical protein STVIR_5889 [Streptomyces viridochromogenes Tue57]
MSESVRNVGSVPNLVRRLPPKVRGGCGGPRR